MHVKLWHVPVRLATGAFILNSGLGKRGIEGESAAGMHGWAASVFPQFKDQPPERFAANLSKGEMALGAALLAPVVPSWLAGAALTAFAGSLLRLYWHTPGMHEEGSVRPTQEGTAVAKDVWMAAIGLALVLDRVTDVGRRR